MTPELHEIAETLLLGVPLDGARVSQDGSFHEVLLVPGHAAIRIARDAAAARELPRRTELTARLATMGLPFAVPEPLGPVRTVHGRTAVAVSWIDGAAHPKGAGDPARLREVLDALAAVDLAAVKDLLDVPHAYAGGARWAELMLEQAVPQLPEHLRDEARARIDDALALEPVVPTLVHGDLAGFNMHWDEGGRLVGVLDWDLAQPYDRAVDVACLAWHGWDAVRRAVDGETFRRAVVWYRTFGIEQALHGRADRAAAWLEDARSSGPLLPGRFCR